MATVVAECWLLTLVDDHVAIVPGPGGDFSPTWTCAVQDDESPQRLVADTAPHAIAGTPHSTSWRFQDGTVLLSFVAFAQDPIAGGVVVPLPSLRTGRDDSRIPFERVVQHAARHVAFLLATDPDFECPDRDHWRQASREHVPTVFQDLTEGPLP